MPNEQNGGMRFNDGKIRWSLMSIHALRELVKVLEFGAKKYASWNWSKGLSWTECYDSLQRHATAWLGGEDKDPETGLSHIAHVLCNAMFLVHFIVTRTGTDDRPAAQRDQKEEKIADYTTVQRIQDAQRLGAQDPVVPGGLPDLQAYVRTSGLWGIYGRVDGYGTASTGRDG